MTDQSSRADAARTAGPEGEPASGVLDGVGLLRIDHVGIAVPDLDEAIEFYARTFGMRCVHVEENTDQGVHEAMLTVGPAPESTPDLMAGPAGGPTSAVPTQIQLLAPLTPDSLIARFLDRRGPGVQQVAYTVADIEATSAALRARGLRLVYESPRRGTAGSRVNFVHPKDAGGVLVELVEPAR